MERIGRYEIVRELGRGSMSIVYEGFDGRIDRHLAIKVLRNRYARDVNARQRFLREARAAGGLAHPNIVTVFDVGQAESAPYLVMELLDGGTLDKWLASDRLDSMSIDRLLDLAGQVVRALAYAHNQGVIHRDIKPANIHYDPATGLAKVMDFGIAAIERNTARSDAGENLAGTLTHMAPELFHGQAADARSDLYSLGVVLFQLLTGKLPFPATDAESLVQQIVSHSTLPLEPMRQDTPRELVDLTYRLMALEPESRPASARQVAEEIDEIRDGMRRGLVQSVRRSAAAWRWPLATGIAVALVLMLGLNHVYRTQNRAMAEATYGFGDALSSLIAQETSEALILDDTTALGVLVSDFAVNPAVEYLHISDEAGIVQASTNPYLRGERAPPPKGEPVERESESGVLLHRSDGGLLEFRVPVRFQARRVGEVGLGLDGSQLDDAANATLWMLGIVFCAALLALAIGMIWNTRRQQLGLKRLAWGLKRLHRGQYDFRIESDRRDEFAPAYREFNRLAVRLDEQRRKPKRQGAPAGASDSAAPRPVVRIPDNATLDETLDLSNSEEPVDSPNLTRLPTRK
ncbi:MAG: protein kinase [Wenzhouxiangellaceae bacterium]|nr:protein kinase [Wenzhouxiangellaceae bacterium]